MNIKKAIWLGIVSWVLVFFEVSILMFGFKIADVNKSILHYILLIIVIGIPALIYFKKEKADAKQGFLLGIIFIIVGLILDSIITIPLFVKTYSSFLNPLLIVGFVEGLLITIVAGIVKSPKSTHLNSKFS